MLLVATVEGLSALVVTVVVMVVMLPDRKSSSRTGGAVFPLVPAAGVEADAVGTRVVVGGELPSPLAQPGPGDEGQEGEGQAGAEVVVGQGLEGEQHGQAQRTGPGAPRALALKKKKIVLFFPLVNVHLQMYEELKHASVT